MNFIAIGCTDWRLGDEQTRIENHLKEELPGAHFYFRKEAGPDGLLLALCGSDEERTGLHAYIDRVSGLGASDGFVLVAHTDCAGHRVSEEEHEENVKEAAQILIKKYQRPVYVLLDRRKTDTVWTLETLVVLQSKEGS